MCYQVVWHYFCGTLIVNEGFEEVTGYSRAEATGRNCRFLQGERIDPEAVAEIRRAIDAAEPVTTVLRNYRADGSEFWNKLDIAPIRDADGEVINFIGFQQDTTERVERRRQLRTLDRYLRHNLRNDMNVVQGLAELIREEAEPPLSEYAERITDTTTSLVGSMEKEREITKVLGDEPVVEPIELMSVCRSLVDAIGGRYPEATVSLSGPKAVSVRATPRLSVALEELISNALDHNEGETADVRIEIAADTDEVTVRIADDGPGFPSTEVDILTGRAEETPLKHGQGFGLWLAYLIVRRSGGSIEFEDGDTRGSVVEVVLPTTE